MPFSLTQEAVDKRFYRGHNELDEPSFTQPLMYQEIRQRESVPQRYEDKLIVRGALLWRSAACIYVPTHPHRLREFWTRQRRKTSAKPEYCVFSLNWTNLRHTFRPQNGTLNRRRAPQGDSGLRWHGQRVHRRSPNQTQECQKKLFYA